MWKFIKKTVYFFTVFGILLGIAADGHRLPKQAPREHPPCRLNQFQCDNGICIASEYLCDGKAECSDGSDETRRECSKPEIVCPQFAFRCSYGACVDGDSKCDGKEDCRDGSDEPMVECGYSMVSSTTSRPTCRENQFRCDTGQCIDGLLVCDGSPDCVDRSDETVTTCGLNECQPFTFRCAYGACIDGDKKCDGVRNCADGSDEERKTCGTLYTLPSHHNPVTTVRPPTTRRPTQRPPTQRPPTPTPQILCPTPSWIEHGYWRLHYSQCPSSAHCEPQEDMQMELGIHIVYMCADGYELTDTENVYCVSGGQWSKVPRCREIRCKALDTFSTRANCLLNGDWISCANTVPPRTQAELSCRTSYRQEDSIWSRTRVTCDAKGQWDPEPINCIPVCGTKPPKLVKPLIVGGHFPNVTDYPWHATLYKVSDDGSQKTSICGATIITESLLITAAHCIYDESLKRPSSPTKYVITTGNFFRDYDIVHPSPIVVRKAKVTNIYMNCDFQGLDGNYDRDIAILHVDSPFIFTSYLVPICLDTSKTYAIDLGTNGYVVGFGRTASGATSSIIQALSVPVVPKSICQQESVDVGALRFITGDKFCAGYKNGSSVCDGDSGGGLIFETNSLWYIRGIVSTGIGSKTTGGSKTCNNMHYTVYTEIADHMQWIQDVMLRVDRGQMISECSTQRTRTQS